MKTYNIGIIGHGGFGKFLHHWWNRLDKVKVVAVSGGSSKDDRELGIVKHYEDWNELLSDEQIDIVSIATPPDLHVEMACAALRNGKHVLLEKPVSLSAEGALKIMDTMRETGKFLTVNHMLRYNPLVQLLKKMSSENVFGPLRHAMVSNYAQDESLTEDHWFWDKKVSGGILVEHAVHFIDIVNSLTSQEPVKISGFGFNRNGRQQDQVAANVLYDKGLTASHYHAFSGPGFFEKTTIQLTFDLARIELEGWIPLTGKIEALLAETDLTIMAEFPNWNCLEETSVSELTDSSRPEGWGDRQESQLTSFRFGGISYGVDTAIKGTFQLSESKSEVYGKCVQDIMADLVKKIEDPTHELTITIEDAYKSLVIALEADRQASL